ncbi:hypothetical protein Q0N65_04790 [Corynebacterium tuberculostearicum]|uniref:hypothetical protein n=1 Tax=Corynebacterium tuberculostearicum TaxID=38304 RepID=UPI00264C907B|nr:hypothetical protein [Corynebacterium tuberculostearicum]MDN8596588.1 hypothetical protein [Corynebacterium tuberculostearicum]
MKLFSRKALVAGATALSVAFAGTTVANAEDTTNGSSSEATGVVKELFNSSEDTNYAGDKSDNSKNKEDDRTSKEKADDIKAWIGVFTAVIGALGTLFAFANKYFDLPFGNK